LVDRRGGGGPASWCWRPLARLFRRLAGSPGGGHCSRQLLRHVGSPSLRKSAQWGARCGHFGGESGVWGSLAFFALTAMCGAVVGKCDRAHCSTSTGPSEEPRKSSGLHESDQARTQGACFGEQRCAQGAWGGRFCALAGPLGASSQPARRNYYSTSTGRGSSGQAEL
jgi:hypothetical protein